MADTDTAPAPARLRRGWSFDLVLAAGLVIVAGQLVLKGELLRRSFFIHDDYVYIARAAGHGLDFSYLFQNYNGQFMPLGFAVTWGLTRIAPYDWGDAMVVILTLQAAASLALLRALRTMFGSRWLILVPFTLYAITPMTMPALGWYAAALNSLPLQAALAMAVAAHIGYARAHAAGETAGRDRRLIETLGWVAVGMLASPKAAVIPPLLFAITSAYFFTGSWPAAMRAAWLRYPRMWWWLLRTLAALIVLYALSWISAGPRQDLGGMDGDQVVGFAGRLLGQTFPLYFLGGPWRWVASGENYGTPHPGNGQIALGVLVVAAVIGLSVRYRRVAYRAWVILFAYVLIADVLPPLLGRMAIIGPIIGFETRYVADAAPLVAILGALAFLPLAGEKRPYVRPLPTGQQLPVLAGLACGAYAVAAIWSVHGYGKLLGDTRGAAYVANARRSLSHIPAGADVYPRRMPGYVMDPLFAGRALSPDLLAPLVPRKQRAGLQRQRPTEQPLVLDDTGHLKPAKVVGPASGAPAPGHACWETTFGSVQIPMNSHIAAGTWTVQLSYLAAAPASVVVDLGDGHAVVPVSRKLGRVYFPITGSGDQIKITAPPNSKLCVGDVTVGYTDPAM